MRLYFVINDNIIVFRGNKNGCKIFMKDNEFLYPKAYLARQGATKFYKVQ